METLTDTELHAWFGLLQAHSNLTRQLDEALLRGHRVSLGGHMVLFRIAAAGGRMRMSELAEIILLSPSGASRLVDRLVGDGLVERLPCPGDGRAIHAAITPAGRRLLKQAERTYEAEVRRLFLEHVSAAEVELLAGLWPRIAPSCSR
jgi:DNA-binding MarR family transcriptional regulator